MKGTRKFDTEPRWDSRAEVTCNWQVKNEVNFNTIDILKKDDESWQMRIVSSWFVIPQQIEIESL